jgi:predicted nucleic acid-binding protein
LIVGRGVTNTTNICYVLDSEGLSRAALKHLPMAQRLNKAHRLRLPVLTSSMTLIEAYHDRIPVAAWRWVLSRIIVLPVTEDIANEATELLREARLHGHKHAIDAALAAIVRRQPGNVVVFTSDKDDMARLCGDRAIIKLL